MKVKKVCKRKGFTLVETVIAMGIITIMVTAFLAAFGPAVQGIRKSISAKEANRLATTLEYELSILRADTGSNGDAKYPTAFAKAFFWIKNSTINSTDNYVLIYQYRGDPTSVRSDGSLKIYTGTDGIPGQDYVLQSVVRRMGVDGTWDRKRIIQELAPGVVEGRVFYVRMKQLVFNPDGELVISTNDTEIVDPHSPDDAKDYTDYPEAVIAFQAEFFALKSSLYGYAAKFTPSNDDKPVFTRNMAVRR
jgi:prepilin-type N-terminal cleavage/methylation domain-containing protein